MITTRRSFLRQSALVITTGTLSTDNSLKDAPFVHHVLFWLKDKQNRKDYDSVLHSLKGLKRIKQIKFLHVGSPSISDIDYEASATDATYDFSYLAFFDSKVDKENYLNDPLHKAFFNDFKDVISSVKIYDSTEIH